MNPYNKHNKESMTDEEWNLLTQEEKDLINNQDNNFEPTIRHFQDDSLNDDDLQNIPHFRD
jgi:hypothetical protein